MKIVNSNYLGHIFKLYSKYTESNFERYICDKCNVIVFQPTEEHLYISTLSLLDDIGPIILELSCEQIIIKNIIE